MSRLLLAAASLAVLLLAIPAAAQQPQATLTLSGLAPNATTNSTRIALPFQVDFSLSTGSCPGGGSATVTLRASPTNGTVAASVQPASLSYNFGQLDAVEGRDFPPASAVLLVETPDLVQARTTSKLTITAASSVTCTANAAPAPPSQATEATTTVTFTPEFSERIAGGNGTEPMPGLELPLLALALLAAVAFLRRRSA